MTRSWKDSYATGNPAMDRQHRRLLGLIDALDAAESASAGAAVVSKLLEHVMELNVAHFLSEESLMARVGYPPHDTDEMASQHRSELPLGTIRPVWLTSDEFALDKKLANFIGKLADSGSRTPRFDDRPLRRPLQVLTSSL